MKILGVDFTSSPRRQKPIVCAWGRLLGDTLELQALNKAFDWSAFERELATPAPWVGAFDLPFGMPRELVIDLGWPEQWAALVDHCRGLGKAAFRDALDAYRATRAVGQKFAHRQTDRPAGSSSPMKLVNPPVALMFFEGTPRLLDAGVTIPGMQTGDARIALEGYPGLAARNIHKRSYKSDARQDQTAERAAARAELIEGYTKLPNPLGVRLLANSETLRELAQDASGDSLDAALCALQAAWAAQRRDANFGLPALDPLEGWILTAPFAPIR